MSEQTTRIESGYEPGDGTGDYQHTPQTAPDGPQNDVLTPTAVMQPRTKMKSLRDALKASTHRDPIILKVPSREGVSIRCDLNIASELVEFWQDRSQKKTPGKSDARVDMPRFLSYVLANQMTGVLFNGEEEFTEEGKSLTFATKDLADMLGYLPNQPHAGPKALFGNDGEMMQAGNRVLAEAGYDDVDLVAEDSPTKTS